MELAWPETLGDCRALILSSAVRYQQLLFTESPGSVMYCKPPFVVLFVTVLTITISANILAQLPGKLKLPKVVDSNPQPTPVSSGPAPTQPATATSSGGPYARKPVAPDSPMLLADTLEIRTETWDYYWKAPGQTNYTSWLPRIHFYIKYKSSARVP